MKDKRLYPNTVIFQTTDGKGVTYYNKNVLEQITAEIRQIVDEETEHDETWARGLHYSLCIIDKHMKGDTDENND